MINRDHQLPAVTPLLLEVHKAPLTHTFGSGDEAVCGKFMVRGRRKWPEGCPFHCGYLSAVRVCTARM